MNHWTTAQETILRECASLGAEFVAKEIARKTGVRRSAKAVDHHASRLGVSLRRYETCPRCGRREPRLNRKTGLCQTCNVSELTDRNRKELAERQRLRKELEEDVCNTPEFQRKWREYRAVCRANEREAAKVRNLQEFIGFCED